MLPLRDIVVVAIAAALLGFLVGWWFSRLPDERPDTFINKLRDIRTLVRFWLAAALCRYIRCLDAALDRYSNDPRRIDAPRRHAGTPQGA
jgi:hypothetical protein